MIRLTLAMFAIGAVRLLPLATEEMPQWVHEIEELGGYSALLLLVAYYVWKIEPRIRENVAAITRDFAAAMKQKDTQMAESLAQQRADHIRAEAAMIEALNHVAKQMEAMVKVTYLHVGQVQKKWTTDEEGLASLKRLIEERL
jgi:hypothetical protein